MGHTVGRNQKLKIKSAQMGTRLDGVDSEYILVGFTRVQGVFQHDAGGAFGKGFGHSDPKIKNFHGA